ncbi:acyltransferase family protein [Lysinibacillus sp. SGAir0095]|uniref:acyltransferase family protein n=1 Tax=Lysinibacillus sp. SGAir0095 TaxID=2070463 RepID=UPI00143DD2F2|nr:acyltransferase family protein [Lysinibacillus sp. SGAir0095]
MRIKEWDLLRVVACLSVLLLHTTTFNNQAKGATGNSDLVHFLRILLCYATPTFILLSIIILATIYRNQVPGKFWSKRIQFLILPFLFWGIVDAFVSFYVSENADLSSIIYENIFTGRFVGWFILVILQLYLLYWCMVKFKWNSIIVLPLAVLLYFLQQQFFALPIEFNYENGRFEKLYGTMWLIYFVAAYLIGVHYEKIRPVLKKYRFATIIFTALAALYIWTNFQQGQTDIHSRRMDLVPFVVGMTSMILAYGQLLPHFKIVQIISKYAFMIYLIHWNILNLTVGFYGDAVTSSPLRILLMFTVTLILSIQTAKILSYLPFGKWIVGKVR